MTPGTYQQDKRFRRCERLRLREDMARVFAQKCTASDRQLVVYVAANGLAWSRLGRSVGKRVGNAIQRNRVRRWIREAFRTEKARIPAGLDIVVVAKPAAAKKWSESPKDIPAGVIPLGNLSALITKAAKKLTQRARHSRRASRADHECYGP